MMKVEKAPQRALNLKINYRLKKKKINSLFSSGKRGSVSTT